MTETINEYQAKLIEVAELCGIKLAPVEEMLKVYPDQFLGFYFQQELNNKAAKAKKQYSEYTQKKLIKAFKSHSFKHIADIYGHNGLSVWVLCNKCNKEFKLPRGDWSDEFILSYHYIYGKQNKFDRITRCR